jgi:hypothetical protein
MSSSRSESESFAGESGGPVGRYEGDEDMPQHRARCRLIREFLLQNEVHLQTSPHAAASCRRSRPDLGGSVGDVIRLRVAHDKHPGASSACDTDSVVPYCQANLMKLVCESN